MDISIGLIRRCKQRDKEAFNELLQRYEKQLYRICCYYCQNKEQALDTMQEVYVRIFRFIESFDEARPIFPWLKRIAVNTCLNYQRDQGKLVGVSLDALPALSETLQSVDDVEADVMAKDSERILQNAILDLDPKYRMALTLRYVEGMSYQEMASLLKQPLGTVKSTVFRGRGILKEVLERENFWEV